MGSPGRFSNNLGTQKADFGDDHTRRLVGVHRLQKNQKKFENAIFRDFCRVSIPKWAEKFFYRMFLQFWGPPDVFRRIPGRFGLVSIALLEIRDFRFGVLGDFFWGFWRAKFAKNKFGPQKKSCRHNDHNGYAG